MARKLWCMSLPSSFLEHCYLCVCVCVCVCECEWVSEWVVIKHFIQIFLDTIDAINIQLYIIIWYLEALTTSYYFQWPWPYFKVTVVSNSWSWNSEVTFLSKFMSNLVQDLYDPACACYFWLWHVNKIGNWCDLFQWKGNVVFLRQCLCEVHQTLLENNLYSALPNTSFDYTDLISRSQPCENVKTKVLFCKC